MGRFASAVGARQEAIVEAVEAIRMVVEEL